MNNICFVLYDFSIVGGVERVVENLANKLTSYYKVHVVSLHGEKINPALRFHKDITITTFNLKNARLRTQLIQSCFKLRKYFEEHHIRVAFLEAPFVGFIGSPLGLFSKTKVVFCDHGALLNQYNDKTITMMRRIASILCDKIVVLTKRSKNDYQHYFHIRESKIVYIYNWVREAIIDENRIYNTKSRVILTVGRFTREKGYDLLIQVAQKILPLNPDWEWHIYGDGPLKQMIQEKILSNGLEQSLIIKGFSQTIGSAYEKSALYVLPSYREGVPLVLLEAKAYKLPCIAFDIITGPNEIIENGINGYLIESYDVDSMANCIVNLINSPQKRKELSDKSYSNINDFREDKVFCQWIELIKELVDSK